MNRLILALSFLPAMSIVSPVAGAAQARFENDARVSCTTCSIGLGSPLVLRENPHTPLGPVVDVVRTDSGKFLVFVWTSPDEILVFDRNGRGLRSMGRSGAGPGEFRRITSLAAGPADTLYVADNGNKRVTVFAGELTPVRTMPIWGTVHWGEMIVVPSVGALVSARRITTAGGWSEYPLHLVRDIGDSVVSFGRLDDQRPTLQPYLTERRIAAGKPGRVWAAMENEYRLEEWNLDGTPRTVIIGRRDWFTPYDDPLADHDRAPPVPRIRALHLLPGGELGIVLWRAAPNWRDGMEWRDGHDRKYLLPTQYWLAYETVIEIIDPRDGTLIATTTVPGTILGFVDSEKVWDYAEDEGGNPRVTLRTVRLRR